ncbi:helix-turn-helix domain-containing protein [Prolixibacteraceae bacterium Z1-6]|uniref:Helix-turn-helix domain-containing protein n=1 Tax=Draconibacterium aestuarii TaxID=2998507 RepID=A0A9X3F507_9BACT|nr:helix-turn-helix domain-containing protein [Prolixibacteraceae bacterium Z1-6]
MAIDDYFSIFLLFGAVISLLFSFFLLFYPNRFYANKVLGFLIFSWAVTVFTYMVQSSDFLLRFPHFYALLDVFVLLFFPVMYIYIRTYLYTDARKIRKNVVHFIPGILYLIIFTPFFIQDTETKIRMIQNDLPGWFRPLQNVFNLVIIFQGIFYTILSLRKLHHFQYFRESRLTKFQLESLKWLRLFVIINVILWTIGTAGVFLEISGINIPIDLFALFYLCLTLLTLVLGVFTIRRPEFFSEEEDILKFAFKSGSSSTDKKTVTQEKELLLKYLEDEKPYLKPDLKMQDMVEATGLSYKRISELFNNELKKSFFDMVNEYRFQTALNLIREGYHKKHTLPYLAEQAGFNSKTTFNRTFKKYTGQTPTEYIQQNNL